MEQQRKTREANRTTWIGLAVNIILTSLKFVAGTLGRSEAMLADAAHSVSDVATDIIALGGIKIAGRPADDNHDYGHGKYETLASALIGGALFVAAVGMCGESARRIWNSMNGTVLTRPGALPLAAAIISIATKEILYRYTLGKGRRLQSQTLVANAWHHRSDALSSIAAAAGIGGALILGGKWMILDPLAAVLVSFLVAKVAWKIMSLGIGGLTDESLDGKTKGKILELANGAPEVLEAHNLKTRRVGTTVAIDLHICVDSGKTVAEAHDIASKIEADIRNAFGRDAFVSIHVEPETERKKNGTQ